MKASNIITIKKPSKEDKQGTGAKCQHRGKTQGNQNLKENKK